MLGRAHPTPIGCVAEHHRGCFLAAGGSVVAHVHPQPPGLGRAATRVEHRHRRIVGMQLGGAEHVALEGANQRIEQVEALAHPFGERRAFQLDAFSGVDLRLAVQGQVIGVLRHQHVCEQARAG